MKIVLTVFKFFAGGLGVVLWFYRNSLFTTFAREGTSEVDAIHTVLVNNHGSFSYITLDQSDHLRALVIASGVLVGLMIVMDLVQRRFLSPPA